MKEGEGREACRLDDDGVHEGLDVRVALEEVYERKDVILILELHPRKQHTAAAGTELTACEGEAAERCGMAIGLIDDPFDDLPRQPGRLHGKSRRKRPTVK